jgi:hypothetical protein
MLPICLLALLSLGAAGVVRAQGDAGQGAEPTTQAQAPAAAEAAPEKPAANPTSESKPAEGPKPQSQGISAAEVSAIVALIVLGAGALYFTYLFVQHIRYGHKVGIESHWGGLGGGLGGWRISSALCFLIGSLVFAASFSALAIRLLDLDARPPVAANAPADDAAQ